MGRKAGTLLWNRMRINVPAGVGFDVDTGLTQVNKSFPDMSPGEPPLGVSGVVAPVGGTPPASRIEVIPLSPISKWASITHSEPYFNTTTSTVHVAFNSGGETGVADLNVLFWDPHSMVGPGDADTYNPLL
jgi:hypothetical protein